MESTKNVSHASVQKAHGPSRACKLLRNFQRCIAPSMEICANSVLYLHPGRMVEPMQCTYEKEGKGLESPKIQTMRRCKKPTDLVSCWKINYKINYRCHEKFTPVEVWFDQNPQNIGLPGLLLF